MVATTNETMTVIAVWCQSIEWTSFNGLYFYKWQQQKLHRKKEAKRRHCNKLLNDVQKQSKFHRRKQQKDKKICAMSFWFDVFVRLRRRKWFNENEKMNGLWIEWRHSLCARRFSSLAKLKFFVTKVDFFLIVRCWADFPCVFLCVLRGNFWSIVSTTG